MRQELSLQIVASGVLSVVVTAPARTYVGIVVNFVVSWTPVVGLGAVQINYGDGITDAGIHRPSPISFLHTYATPGVKPITVTVTDEDTSASGKATSSIELANPLAITFTANKTGGAIPLDVDFSFTMSGGFAPIIWDLVPEPGVTYPNPTSPKRHTYTKAGTFTAKFTATDALGVASLSLPVNVTAEGIQNLIGPAFFLAGVAMAFASTLKSRR